MNIKSTTCFNQRNGKPLSEYSSEVEAEGAAIYVNSQHRTNLAPYQCSRCGQWHLSPKNRQTPSRACNICTDTFGSAKELYETREAAQKRARIIRKEKGVKLSVYQCPYNNGWHLTKRG
ncbi:MAG: hypothetical protein PF904_11700 [Kiritimatiellae bacterium]|jgi:hypothetical protein|nr:hypothetical protein [Kiritimatiellia bacterium]